MTTDPGKEVSEELKPCEDAAIMRLWRECGLPEYFLGNGGTNHKLVAFAMACRRPPPADSREREEAIEAAKRIVAASDRFDKCRAEFPIERDWNFDACGEWEDALTTECISHGVTVARALLSSPRDIRGEALEEAATVCEPFLRDKHAGAMAATIRDRIRSLKS